MTEAAFQNVLTITKFIINPDAKKRKMVMQDHASPTFEYLIVSYSHTLITAITSCLATLYRENGILINKHKQIRMDSSLSKALI